MPNNSISNISPKNIRKWMMSNFWEFAGVNSQGHEEWEYHLECDDGNYAKDILINSGAIIMEKKPINTHVEGSMREYTIQYIYKYMGLTRNEFIDSFRNGKKLDQKTLIRKFFEAQENHSKIVKERRK